MQINAVTKINRSGCLEKDICCLEIKHKCETKRSFNMLVYNTEFYWMSSLQNQTINWTRLTTEPVYILDSANCRVQNID